LKGLVHGLEGVILSLDQRVGLQEFIKLGSELGQRGVIFVVVEFRVEFLDDGIERYDFNRLLLIFLLELEFSIIGLSEFSLGGLEFGLKVFDFEFEFLRLLLELLMVLFDLEFELLEFCHLFPHILQLHIYQSFRFQLVFAISPGLIFTIRLIIVFLIRLKLVFSI
jgi:hypothetical protein